MTTTGPTWTFNTTASTDPVFVGVGDIGSCSVTDDTDTGNVIAGIDGTIFTTGDNVYPNGTAADFTNCYAPTPWGDPGVLSRTRPVPGNHDWGTGVTNSLSGYFGYFGANATTPAATSYYSYDIAGSNWHVVNLDSECANVPGGCTAGSAQELWLKADLAANSTKNVIALWHKPRYSSGATNLQDLQPLWDDLYAAGVDILLDGHDHIYERLRPDEVGRHPRFPAGRRPDVRHPAVHGRDRRRSAPQPRHHAGDQPGSEQHDFGIFKLTLHATTYDWVFLPIAGSTFTDSGTGSVHAAPPPSTFSLSGNVKSGATPVSGTFVYVFDAGTSAYVGAASMGPGAAYTINLAAGSYKAYIQTNTPAYPDQWFGGSSMATATVITVSANTTQDLSLVSPPTVSLSGNVKSGATPVSGTFVYVFDAGTSAYVGAASMGPGAAYTINLAAGSYKAYIQTNTPAYPDQWFGGSSMATATVITVSANTTQDLSLVSPPTVSLSGNVKSGATPVSGTFVYVFDAGTSAYVGAASMGPGAAYTINLAAGSYKAYIQTNTPAYPDQWFGGSSMATATVITVSANTTQDLSLVSPPTVSLSGNVKSGATPVSGTFVYVFDAGTSAYVGAASMGPGAAYTINLAAGSYKAYIQTNTPAYPDQWFGGSSMATATVITVSANTTQDLSLVSPPTVSLSGNVKSGATPVSGTFVYVFDAGTSAYVGAASMGPGAAYTINLAAGSYKAYIQTNTPAYPDQWFGGSSMATATVITVSANTTQDLSLVSP